MKFAVSRRLVPSLAALVAFEASARLGSFTRAGEALQRREGLAEDELGEVLAGGLGTGGAAEGKAQQRVGEGEGEGREGLAAQPVAQRQAGRGEQAHEQGQGQADDEALVDPRGEQAGGEHERPGG